jgi:DNA-binding PadR family transcriptional regulator
MTGTYAMGAPWLRFASECGPGARKDLGEFLAWMTGAKTRRGQSSWEKWAMFGGSAPFKPWGEGGGPGWRAMKARRGDVRAAILAVLNEQPMNGYQIIQEIPNRSGDVWRPSPGSVYPALQQLEDEGLIRTEAGDGGRRGYLLTDEGQQYAASHADELRAPWDVVAGGAAGQAIEMRKLIGQVAMAAVQVVSAGTDAQAAQARQVLIDTRKALYRILAADEEPTGAADGE